MRKTLLIFLFSIFAVLLTGCYDKHESDDLGHVLAIGFDKGVKDRLRLTLQVEKLAEVKEAGEGDGRNGTSNEASGSGTSIITVDCPSFFTGLNLANTATTREFNLSHAKLIIFSEQLARSGEMEKYLSLIVRYPQIRRIMQLVIAKGSAEELIKENKTLLSKNPPKSMQLLRDYHFYAGFRPESSLLNFYNRIKTYTEQPVVALAGINSLQNLKEPGEVQEQASVSGGNYIAGQVPRRGGVKREIFGGAVFNGGIMVGEINGDEIRAVDMIRGEFTRGFFTFKDPLDPNLIIAADLRPSRRPQIKVNIQGDNPTEIYTKIPLEGNILAIESRINYEKPELKEILEQSIEQEIREQFYKIAAKCQNDFKADIFGFGRSAVYYFPTIGEWEDYCWLQRFTEAAISFEVDLNLRRTGMMLKSAPIETIEGPK